MNEMRLGRMISSKNIEVVCLKEFEIWRPWNMALDLRRNDRVVILLRRTQDLQFEKENYSILRLLPTVNCLEIIRGRRRNIA